MIQASRLIYCVAIAAAMGLTWSVGTGRQSAWFLLAVVPWFFVVRWFALGLDQRKQYRKDRNVDDR
jgi:hypothetical protein